MKFNPDSYLLYGTNKAPFPAYPIRLRMVMNDDVQAEALRQAAQSAIKRYPYFAVEVGICKPQAGTEYISLAQNSERVADHLINVAKSIRDLQ